MIAYMFKLRRRERRKKCLRFTFIHEAGVVSTSTTHNIDHDVLPSVSILMYITVTDGKWYDTKYLSIQIQNENESPAFSQTFYTTTRDEGVVCRINQ